MLSIKKGELKRFIGALEEAEGFFNNYFVVWNDKNLFCFIIKDGNGDIGCEIDYKKGDLITYGFNDNKIWKDDEDIFNLNNYSGDRKYNVN